MPALGRPAWVCLTSPRGGRRRMKKMRSLVTASFLVITLQILLIMYRHSTVEDVQLLLVELQYGVAACLRARARRRPRCALARASVPLLRARASACAVCHSPLGQLLRHRAEPICACRNRAKEAPTQHQAFRPEQAGRRCKACPGLRGRGPRTRRRKKHLRRTPTHTVWLTG